MFAEAAQGRQWWRIHRAHYDWWMFPIDRPSSYGWAWTVTPGDIAELRQRPGYLDRYREGVRLLLLAWGWDLKAACPVDSPDLDQRWQEWPIRLEKCGRSLWLYDEHEAYASVRAYAQSLIDGGIDLSYSGRDCGDFFREHPAA